MSDTSTLFSLRGKTFKNREELHEAIKPIFDANIDKFPRGFYLDDFIMQYMRNGHITFDMGLYNVI